MPEYTSRLFVFTGIIVALSMVWQAWKTEESRANIVIPIERRVEVSRPSGSETSPSPTSDIVQSRTLSILESKNDGRVLVTRVVDGDTIEIEDGGRVRYIGVNTPETKDPRKPVQCFGKEASAYNQQLVEGKRVRLEADVEDKDRYGRLLRYVWLGDTMVNEALVQNGYAQVMTIPPNVKYVERFKVAQTQARSAKLGLWEKCRR